MGDVDAGIWSAGLSVGLIHDVPSCEELVGRMEREVEGIIEGLGRLRVVKAKL